MKIFLDTNLFAYAIDRQSPFCHTATAVLEAISKGEHEGYCSHQVLAELFAVLTKRVAHPLNSAVAAEEVRRLLTSETLATIPITKDVFLFTLALAERYQIRGTLFFDAQIVGTMLANDIKTLYTANVADFRRFREIEVVNPFKRLD